MAYLWPERDTEHARQLLNQAVYNLRKALGEDALLSGGDDLRLDLALVTVDVAAFESALARGSHEDAVALYRGPFLDGFFLSNAPEFDRWVDGERERLAGAYAQALEALAETARGEQDFGRAVAWWKARAAQDPYDSRVTASLMQVLDASGNRAGALQHAAMHQRLLEEEFGAEPDPAVLALAERIRTGAFAAAAAPLAPTVRVPVRATVPQAAPDGHGDRAAHAGAGDPPSGKARPGLAPASRSAWRMVGVTLTLLGLGLAGWMAVTSLTRKPPEIRRIAVLPLANLTGDPQQEYFVAGMHDALVAELAQIEALTVYSRQSVLRYQGSDRSLPAIARELGVDALIEGSVFRSGDSVRITVQLIRAEPEEHLWAAAHHGPLSHALSLQGEVARAIAAAVRARVAPDVHGRLARGRAVDPAAQEVYLRGLYHLERAAYGPMLPPVERLEEHRTAIRYLEEAAALDPGWAAAHARLAMAYHWLASGFQPDYEAEFYPKSKAAALRALSLDETESQAHASLGFVLQRHDWDWPGAERAFRRAMQLDPNSHHWIYALYLQAAGRHDEAIAHYRMAEERNPVSEILKLQVANAYACAARHDEAIAQARELHARVRPSGRTGVVGDTLWLLNFTSRQYAMKGAHAEAIATAEALVGLTDTLSSGVGLAFAYAMAGRRDEARALAERIENQVRSHGGGSLPAELYAALGDTKRSLDMVEASLEGRRTRPVSFRCSLPYALLRDEPRMRALLTPVGFPR